MKERNQNTINTKIAVLENTVLHIHETLERIENNISIGFANVHDRFEKVNNRLDKLESKVDSNFKWLLLAIFTITGSPIVIEIIKSLGAHT